MYASFRTAMAKNGKIPTPTRIANFLLTSVDWEFYVTLNELPSALNKRKSKK